MGGILKVGVVCGERWRSKLDGREYDTIKLK